MEEDVADATQVAEFALCFDNPKAKKKQESPQRRLRPMTDMVR